MDGENLNQLETATRRLIAALPLRIRPFSSGYPELPRALLLVGPRGSGKTTFLLYHARNRKILYLSADSPLLGTEPLYEIVRSVFMAGYEGVIIDEVHFSRDWSRHLKALYDSYPQHRIWVSDSSALVLRTGVGDLSRRFVPIQMPLLSFREFLFLENGDEYPVCDPFESGSKLPVEPVPAILDAFCKYRECGIRPFYGEGNFRERILSVLDKTLYSDIPFFLPRITDGNLRLMKAIVGTLAAASIPRLQVRSLCADWGIGAEKLYQILNVMESVGLVRIIRFENDRKALSAGAKLFFADPVFYPNLYGDTGTAREAMVAFLCAAAGWSIEAARNEREADFILSREGRKIAIEVGGETKGGKAADYVIRDSVDYPSDRVIPLWLLGMSF